MKLTIIAAVASCLIKFTTPGPGTFYLLSIEPGAYHAKIEMSDHVWEPEHVTCNVKNDAHHRMFFVQFVPDSNP